MQVLGYAHEPILGIINHQNQEIDLCECPLYSPKMQKLLSTLRDWIKIAGITPYKIEKKKGELKYILVTHEEHSDTFMIRFVLKSHKYIPAIKEHLHRILEPFPNVKVVSVNIQPIHMAVLEGNQEIYLTQEENLKTYLNKVPLFIRAQSFFQTNSDVASQLYKEVQTFVKQHRFKTIYDLFCGVGGFALHVATQNNRVTGIEISPQAIKAAQTSAKELGVEINFKTLDANLIHESSQPDLIIVNPPRAGLQKRLCQTLLEIAPQYLCYSSCNIQTLKEDLKILNNDYTIESIKLFDMFAHSWHYEVLVILKKFES